MANAKGLPRSDSLPPAEVLRWMMDYSPETGEIIWRVRVNGRVPIGAPATCKHPSGYIYVQVFGRKFQAHRIAWAHFYGEWPSLFLDHIDGDRANNRIANLREATKSQNSANRGAASTKKSSVFKGIYFDKRSLRWRAIIGAYGQRIELGRFATEQEAVAAYDQAAAREFGSFARPQ
jgi:hypothetical protein